MTTITNESGRLARLKAALVEQRDAVAALLRRLTCFGSPGSMKPSLFHKFMKTLEQIALEKDTETEIINRIQDIETRHRFQRGCKKLKPASHETKAQKDQNGPVEYEPEQTRSGVGWLFAVWLLAMMSQRRPKPQE